MNHLKKVLLLIMLITIGGLLLMGCLLKDQSNQYENFGVINSKTFKNIQINSIDVDCIPIDISIIPYSENMIKAEIYGNIEKPDSIRLSVNEMNNCLNFTVNKKDHSIFSIKGKGREKLMIYLPQKYENSLNIKTSDGSADINGFHLKKLVINATSGHINVADLEVDVCDLNNSSGSIKISGFKGDLSAKNTSGGISVEYEALLNNHISLSSKSGSVKLELPTDPNFYIKAKTLSGKIICNYPLVTDIKKRNEIKGVCNEALNNVIIKAESGSIYIR